MLKALGVFVAIFALSYAGWYIKLMLEHGGGLSYVLAICSAAALAFVSLRYLVFPSVFDSENDRH
ncbi:hypothetical protein OO256_26770 [Pseudomonas sp. DCB_CB]|uniref:hypothetical protein n=1 Tax=unclassified Pseudomonas TaxID=196821 RepID=UPI0022493D89|nr:MULTISPECIES: hypothetical protein [unclassified Pseudomonas]MCX2694481.1 hypothetical protein [Pseudomonas sp. DCB_BZ]MCX2859689.1 hypothetical protein [Pseudomonas sp. DCB_CB]